VADKESEHIIPRTHKPYDATFRHQTVELADGQRGNQGVDRTRDRSLVAKSQTNLVLPVRSESFA